MTTVIEGHSAPSKSNRQQHALGGIAKLPTSDVSRLQLIQRLNRMVTLLAMLANIMSISASQLGLLPLGMTLVSGLSFGLAGVIGGATYVASRRSSVELTCSLFIYGYVVYVLGLTATVGGAQGSLFVALPVLVLITALCGRPRDVWCAVVFTTAAFVALSFATARGWIAPIVLFTTQEQIVFNVILLIAVSGSLAYLGLVWRNAVAVFVDQLQVQSGELFAQTETLLEQNIQQVEVGNELAAASTQLLSAAEQQARGATEQASAVSEISTTIEELGATARQIASGAEQVTAAAGETLMNLADGQAAVDTAIQAMSQIRVKVRDVSERVLSLGERSHQIGEIIDVINDLSDETHLLALNAAIEAAGAGEHGRRFAVVAAEVKSLANRALAAAKEVKGVIAQVQQATNAAVLAAEDGGKEVDRGVVLANKAGSVMDQIMVAAERTAQVAAEINLATAQQQSASEQIVETMRDVADVARQTASSARQTTGSAQALAAIANRLHGLALSAE